jgi:uncharacterized protein (TIGR00251 family)
MTINVQITANASRNEVVGWIDGRLKIKVKAPAVEGKANAELLRFLAERLDLRPNRLQIVRGGTARRKTIEIEGVTEDFLRERLA